ncbi:MAG: molybdopterin molybdotransferase MoeA [Firmicutes bacterium]|nr:molybdopterin molybdotransferase MoeA [Bacillota bacterium]
MKFLETDTLEQARQKLLHAAQRLELRAEDVAIEEACGRVLARPVRAGLDVPDFRKSTVDGYAVRAKDTQGAGESIPCFLEVRGEVSIGHPAPGEISAGECMYVPTGGMLPEGADAMVMVEHAESFDAATIAVYSAVSPGRNVIQTGEDARAGEVLLEAGRRLAPADIGVLASVGLRQVSVYEMPSITILSTGNELVDPGEAKQPGQVYDINTYGIAAQCGRWQIPVRRMARLADDAQVLREAVSGATADSDIVVLSGGSSKGRADYTAQTIDALASPGVFTHGIRIKPGKPTILGFDEPRGTLLVGLPGHPAAAMMVFDLLVLWLLRKKMGVCPPRGRFARMEVNVPGGSGRTVCQMVQLIPADTAATGPAPDDLARPLLGASGLIGVLSKADGYVMIPADKEGLKKGETVEVIPL